MEKAKSARSKKRIKTRKSKKKAGGKGSLNGSCAANGMYHNSTNIVLVTDTHCYV